MNAKKHPPNSDCGCKSKSKETVKKQIDTEAFKQQIEQFKKALSEKMKDPNLAKKAAHLLSLWIAGEKPETKKTPSEASQDEKKKKKAA